MSVFKFFEIPFSQFPQDYCAADYYIAKNYTPYKILHYKYYIEPGPVQIRRTLIDDYSIMSFKYQQLGPAQSIKEFQAARSQNAVYKLYYII